MNAAVWLLLLVPIVLSVGTSALMRHVFRRYRAVRNRAGLTGAQVARALLDARGLYRVRIGLAPGYLSDNYDGEGKRLSLSGVVAHEATVSALGIAGHEVGHAEQDAEGDRAYRARRSIAEPLAAAAPLFSVALIGGFWFRVPSLVVLALAYAAGLVVFALATLPVEVGASHRAMSELRRTRLADPAEERGVRLVLAAAALTYVVGLLDRLGYFLVLAFAAEAMRRYAAGGAALIPPR